ncbi:uncharacterized protein LOC125497428 [Beta vulgaris subsp. vulgaris]|uniref:uncharacterized protein LOC125497428 n=1 Tax=Beta vulgaris subsp. vulgaris TaxID=3555 RepID=UPI0020374B68|nr:uncharacterized protein LOC125497428 [Beta vulgaris subsp. vulgaris]XP_048500225.1 uncharacterized protein LOC125497428 [Beta vulgaris subsp. vulgaris]XP_048500227.1 uncharacterized protein LOC125497428 [Beta vulgaris subsp. vulgaris]XP_048500228.1 uncharacterized protein LOC125497428 [Beta vulgaris subsp. vulgaris]XP_048500229.1 uncharacterized protein LOC125497428 [Beta vulgaris subsp. vulgaris]XP_048500230.1 uncharacterized protein LOC125497428 [Beta vulgaris subsp. vulgaris]XP_04850023
MGFIMSIFGFGCRSSLVGLSLRATSPSFSPLIYRDCIVEGKKITTFNLSSYYRKNNRVYAEKSSLGKKVSLDVASILLLVTFFSARKLLRQHENMEVRIEEAFSVRGTK